MKAIYKFVIISSMFSLLACCNNVRQNDLLRITNIIKPWGTKSWTGGPFSAHVEWAYTPSFKKNWKDSLRDSGLNELEFDTHASIDSISDNATLRPIKNLLHLYVTNVYAEERLETVLTYTVFHFDDLEFKGIHSFERDSLLLLSCQLLNKHDTLARNIKRYAEEFNKISSTMGLDDSIGYKATSQTRENILNQFYYCLDPRTKKILLLH